MLKLTTHSVKTFGAFLLCAVFSVAVYSDDTTTQDAIPAPEFSLPAIANAEGRYFTGKLQRRRHLP